MSLKFKKQIIKLVTPKFEPLCEVEAYVYNDFAYHLDLSYRELSDNKKTYTITHVPSGGNLLYNQPFQRVRKYIELISAQPIRPIQIDNKWKVSNEFYAAHREVMNQI